MPHFSTISRVPELERRIAFVSAFGSQLCEVAGLGTSKKFVQMLLIVRGERCNVVGVETARAWTVQGSKPVRRKLFFLVQNGPGRLWGKSSFLLNAYQGLFSDGKS
jgi:hypothetical protein